MNCPNCNAVLEDGVKFCHSCGANVEVPTIEEPVVETPTVEEPTVSTPVVQEPIVETPTPEPKIIEKPYIPEQYQPLSPWAYFGLGILFNIPVVGFVFLIVFSFSKGNINRRNFARSYWCAWIILAIIAVIIIALAIVLTVASSASYNDISFNGMAYM